MAEIYPSPCLTTSMIVYRSDFKQGWVYVMLFTSINCFKVACGAALVIDPIPRSAAIEFGNHLKTLSHKYLECIRVPINAWYIYAYGW